jgi:hypothetical protein
MMKTTKLLVANPNGIFSREQRRKGPATRQLGWTRVKPTFRAAPELGRRSRMFTAVARRRRRRRVVVVVAAASRPKRAPA